MSKNSLRKNFAGRREQLQQQQARGPRKPYTPPTDEQLVNFVCASIGAVSPIQREVVAQWLAINDGTRAVWLAQHRAMQEALW